MATALVLDADGQRIEGRWPDGAVKNLTGDVSPDTWKVACFKAGVILDCKRELAVQVVNGELAIDRAYRLACEARDAAKVEAAKAAREAEEEDEARAFIQENAPEIAALVGGDIQNYVEALAVWEKRHREEADRIAAEKAEEERQHRVATHLLCHNLVVVAQLRGGTTARKYRADMALPGRAVTMQTWLDAQQAIKEGIAMWKEEGFE